MKYRRSPSQKICWIASYPKSGNTWTRILLAQLLRDGDGPEAMDPLGAIASNRTTFDHITGLPSSDMTNDEIDLLRPAVSRQIAADAKEMTFIKAHDAYCECPNSEPLFPTDCSFGAIYLVRNPLDVAVSFAYHQGHQNFAQVAEHMNNPIHSIEGGTKPQLRQKLMGWNGHYRSWHNQAEIPILTIRYEDMIADTADCLSKMASFIGLTGKDLPRRIQSAVEHSRFDKLRDKEQSTGFKEKPERAEQFFRSGRAGEGAERLSQELQRKIIDANQDLMSELNYV